MRTVIYLCGGLLLGSLLFSVSGAVVTGGTVVGRRRIQTVQHLEGGIVQKFWFTMATASKTGDVLVHLDDTQARASMAATSGKFADYAIQEARLIAERDRKDTLRTASVG